MAMCFVVSAAPLAPTDLTFGQNTTAQYDKEGIFSVNWTSGGGDEVNYSVYVSVDGGTSWYLKGDNNSATGYSFSNTTDANYTFRVEAVNNTLDAVNSSSDVSMSVDTTSPFVNAIYPAATNYAAAPTTLNFTYTETNCENAWYSNDSGVTNYSVQACTSNFSSMVASEGNNTWIVYMNDSAGNINSSSVVFVLDTTSPVATASCSPSSVSVGATVTCTCSGTDAGGSGINVSLTTAGSTPSTSSAGTFSYTCSVTDNVGNSDNDSASYVVTAVTSSSGGSGNYPTYSPSESKLSEGYDISLGTSYKVNFYIGEQKHRLEVDSISTDKVTITISSDPITLDIVVGDTERVDADGDGVYDLSIFLKGVSFGRANFILTSISELVADSDSVPEEEVAVVGDTTDDVISTETPEVAAVSNSSWMWFVLILAVAGIVAWKSGFFDGIRRKKALRR